MPVAMENGMKVTMTETAFGRIWVAIMRELEAPRARAARTYSRDFSLYVDVRMYQVICVQLKITMIAASVQKVGTTMLATIMMT